MNILFVSHCDFTGNSAMHIFSIAKELQCLGQEPAICVPKDPTTVADLGPCDFPVLSYAEALERGVPFSNGRGPDLVHAWTPRERVRQTSEQLAAQYACPCVVHLEDSEDAVIAAYLSPIALQSLGTLPDVFLDSLILDGANWLSHPRRYPQFLARSAGMTVLMDRLLEFKPDDVPGLVFWPGFDKEFAGLPATNDQMRTELGLAAADPVVVYTGNVHECNLAEVTTLYVAVKLLRRRGYAVRLVKTGWNGVPVPWLVGGVRDEAVIELGFVPRQKVPQLLSMADVLVQPGRPDPFNDYRFPSKLPEVLVSGKPVLLPLTNLGRFLRDGVEAVLLTDGTAIELAGRLEQLLRDPRLRARIGQAGREFALRRLTWAENAKPVRDFYESVLESWQSRHTERSTQAA